LAQEVLLQLPVLILFLQQLQRLRAAAAVKGLVAQRDCLAVQAVAVLAMAVLAALEQQVKATLVETDLHQVQVQAVAVEIVPLAQHRQVHRLVAVVGLVHQTVLVALP
jgi:hypothetical protein